MKYWHELSKEESERISKKHTWGYIIKRYKQPDWCEFPQALEALGCWGLIYYAEPRNRKSCNKCEYYKSRVAKAK